MSRAPRQAPRATHAVKRFGRLARIVVVLAAVTSLVGCQGGSGSEGQPAPSGSHATATATATPVGGGEVIVFERLRPIGKDRDLYTVGPDGGEPQLLRSPGEYPHWSPDGSQLAFLACLNPPDCTTAVARMERSSGEVHGFPMTDPDLFTPCAIWAPSGQTLACGGTSENAPTRNGVYTVLASDGTGLTQITRNPGGFDSPLAYSPDGRRLLLVRSRGLSEAPRDQALFVAPVSGGQAHQITPWGYSDDYASWSPDGRTIVFGTAGSLFRVSPEGTGLAKIALRMPDGSSATHAFDVSFSPDGRRIVFSLGGAEPGLYLARPDGGGVKRLTTSPTEDHHANWGAAVGA